MAEEVTETSEALIPIEGLTKREWFAAQSLIALCNCTPFIVRIDKKATEDGIAFKDLLAQHAYTMADSMIAQGESDGY